MGWYRRLRRPHLSLYLVLLVQSRGGGAFRVNRKKVMAWARIGSRTTYNRCLRDLDRWDYLFYLPSYDPSSKSQVYIRPLSKDGVAAVCTEGCYGNEARFLMELSCEQPGSLWPNACQKDGGALPHSSGFLALGK